MTSEIEAMYAEWAMLEAIAFLQRNGFTKIKQRTHDYIDAMDGSRKVLVYLDLNELPLGSEPGDISIPMKAIEEARESRIRLDVVAFRETGTEKLRIWWFMNTIELV